MLFFIIEKKEDKKEVVEIIKMNGRGNGFELPLHPLQVISWFVFGYDLFVYFFISMVSLSNYGVFVALCSIIYISICAGVVFYAVKGTRCNPSDPTIRLQKEAEARG